MSQLRQRVRIPVSPNSQLQLHGLRIRVRQRHLWSTGSANHLLLPRTISGSKRDFSSPLGRIPTSWMQQLCRAVLLRAKVAKPTPPSTGTSRSTIASVGASVATRDSRISTFAACTFTPPFATRYAYTTSSTLLPCPYRLVSMQWPTKQSTKLSSVTVRCGVSGSVLSRSRVGGCLSSTAGLFVHRPTVSHGVHRVPVYRLEPPNDDVRLYRSKGWSRDGAIPHLLFVHSGYGTVECSEGTLRTTPTIYNSAGVVPGAGCTHTVAGGPADLHLPASPSHS